VPKNLPVSRNLPKSTLNLRNRHKKSNWPKKAKFHLAFSNIKKSQKSWKKLKTYIFDLRKAKLATLDTSE